MAKNKKIQAENEEVVESTEQIEVEETSKKSKKESKSSKKASKNNAQNSQKKSRAKETIGELKKVSWPSFGKTMKQTGMVLSLVLVFGVVVLGIDLLISFIINLLSSF